MKSMSTLRFDDPEKLRSWSGSSHLRDALMENGRFSVSLPSPYQIQSLRRCRAFARRPQVPQVWGIGPQVSYLRTHITRHPLRRSRWNLGVALPAPITLQGIGCICQIRRIPTTKETEDILTCSSLVPPSRKWQVEGVEQIRPRRHTETCRTVWNASLIALTSVA